jgi:hypothetical protein
VTAPKAAQLFEVDGVPGRVRRVRRGVDATVKALRDGGRLEPVDAALVAVARTLADALDDERSDVDGSAFTVGALAGKLTPVLDRLRGQAVPDGFDDELRAALFGPLPDAPPA